MPESATNRCTKAHEYVFLFSQQPDYYYDAEVVKEKSVTKPHKPGWARDNNDRKDCQVDNEANHREWGSATSNKRDVWEADDGLGLSRWLEENAPDVWEAYQEATRGKADVWRVSSGGGYKGAHFATFPPELITPCILAGTSARGACANCGAPWWRLTKKLGPQGGRRHGRKGGTENPYNAEDQWGLDAGGAGANWPKETVGWQPTCACRGAAVRPCIVLDPFVGSGTTPYTCVKLGRWGWGIDLSEDYLRSHALPRVKGALLGVPALRGMVGH
jgi:hypothetical protein